MKKTLTSLSFLLSTFFVFSQNENVPDTLQPTLSITDLSAVTVTSYRLEEMESEVPMAVSRIGNFRLHRGEQQLTLNDALSSVPGLYAQNDENFAQDLRVSIRGFGARSSFGIRGVKVFMDGFPETTPDGTGQVDNIDPGAVRSIEVIRGQTSGLYGNASGGYMNFTTLDFSGNNYLESSFRLGSFGFQKAQLKSVGKAGRINYSLFGSTMNREGYRDNSDVVNYLFNGGFQLPFDSTLTLTLAINYVNSPNAGEPGSLHFDNVEGEPKLSYNPDWREKVRQNRVGILLDKKWGTRNKLSFRGFQTVRRFENVLFGNFNELHRNFNGAQLSWNHTFRTALPWQFSLGAGIESQLDEREVFDYLGEPIKKGELEDKRVESYSNSYVMASSKLSLIDFFHLHFGARYDHIDIAFQNEFLSSSRNERVEDEQNHTELNAMAGISMSFDPNFSMYFNFSSAFETPSLRESISFGADSLNQNLMPQRAKTRELGIKGWLNNGSFHYDLALFLIRTEDEILVSDLDDFFDQFEYENVGLTDRKGFELSLGYRLAKYFYGYTSFTNSNFIFKSSDAPSTFNTVGNHLPGIPLNLFWTEFRYQPPLGFFSSVKVKWVGKQYAENENEVEIDPYLLLGIRAGYAWKKGKIKGEIFGGVNNLMDEFYFSNIRINNPSQRYYEPAPGRNFVVGLSFRFGR